MKKLFMLLAVIISLINLNAQVNPPQKVVTNITKPLVNIKADSIQSKMIRFSTTMFGGMEQRIAPNADMNFSGRYNTNPNTVTISNAEIVI